MKYVRLVMAAVGVLMALNGLYALDLLAQPSTTAPVAREDVKQEITGAPDTRPADTRPADTRPADTLPAPTPRPAPPVPETPAPLTPAEPVQCIHVDATRRADDGPPPLVNDAAAIRRAVDAAMAQPGRGGARPVIVMTWTACHGALSQHYGHLSALTISRRVRPDVIVLPHARSRDSFGNRNNVKQEINNVSWSEIDMDDVYETGSFYDAVRGGGADGGTASSSTQPWNVSIFRHPTPAGGRVALPSSLEGYQWHHTEAAAAKFGLPSGTPVVQVRYHRRRQGWIWEEMIARRVMLEKGNSSVVVVDLGCMDVAVSANKAKGLDPVDVAALREVHERLRLQQHIVRAGESLVKQMQDLSEGRAARTGRGRGGAYLGLHMRIERDMHSTVDRERAWEREYERTLPAFLDDHDLPVLVASGVFDYAPPTEIARIFAPYAGHPLYRTCASPALPKEVMPWVDYIGLRAAAAFEGHENSAFTWLIIEHRTAVDRRPLSTANLVRVQRLPLGQRVYRHIPDCCENNRCLNLACVSDDGSTVQAVDPALPVVRPRFKDSWLHEHENRP